MTKQEFKKWLCKKVGNNRLFSTDGTAHGSICMDDGIPIYSLVQSAIAEAEQSKWKPYPKNKELVISDQLYVVTLKNETVHSVFGISFEQVGVIAFQQPKPYKETDKLNTINLSPKQRATMNKYFKPE